VAVESRMPEAPGGELSLAWNFREESNAYLK
jgi:hypothetical protein